MDIKGSKRIKVVNLHCLKEFSVSSDHHKEHDIELVEVEAPSLEHASLEFNRQFKLQPSNNLKKLVLFHVNIPDKFLTDLEDNFPKLEDLSILLCSLFERFNIESKSLKSLSIKHMEGISESDAPNLVSFKYNGCLILRSIRWKLAPPLRVHVIAKYC